MNSCSFSAKFHGLDLLCHCRNLAVLFLHRFLFIQLFFLFTDYYKCSNKKLCRVATLMSFFGKYRYHYQKGQERASCVSHGSIKRISYLCNAYAAEGCALSSSHPTTRAFRFPCSACAAVAAHCRVASDCPSPSLPCNAWFFFYRLTCSYRFMFFL